MLTVVESLGKDQVSTVGVHQMTNKKTNKKKEKRTVKEDYEKEKVCVRLLDLVSSFDPFFLFPFSNSAQITNARCVASSSLAVLLWTLTSPITALAGKDRL